MPVIPNGARFLAPKMVCAKFAKQKSWLWARVKNDPCFPKPVYLSRGEPVFLEHELDEYIARLAQLSRKTG